jgi:hypothetical protein
MKVYDEEASRGKPVNSYDTLLYPEIVERPPKSPSKTRLLVYLHGLISYFETLSLGINEIEKWYRFRLLH